MSEKSWVLRGVDPESRQAAEAEAERLGISLADYLTSLLTQPPEPAAEGDETEAADAEFDALFAAPPPSRENLAFRRRIEALERRLASAMGGLDAAVQELDAAMIGASARLDETEAVTGETAEALRYALADTGANLAALRKRLTDLEDGAGALSESNDAAHADLGARCETLEHRLAEVDGIARAAAAAETTLNAAYGALQQAVAQDFTTLVDEQNEQLGNAVDHMRGIAESAARGADEASARAIEALRVARLELEQRFTGHVENTRAYVDEALEDVRFAALDASRRADEAAEGAATALQTVCENFDQRLSEDAAHTHQQVHSALEEMRALAYEAAHRADETSTRALETLRASREAMENHVANQIEDLRERVHAAFADTTGQLGVLTERISDTESAIVRSAQQLNARIIDVEDNTQRTIEAATDDLRGELGAAIADMMERHHAEATRLNQTDSAIAETARDIAALRAATDARLTEFGEETSAREARRADQLDTRLTAILARLNQAEDDTANARDALNADLVRVETCTFVALEKLAQDIATTSGAQQSAAEQSHAVLEAGLSESRDQISGVMARLRLFDTARHDAEQTLAAMKDEIAGLAAASLQTETTRQALAALEARVEHDLADLRTRSDSALRELQSGLAALSSNRPADEGLAQKLDETRARISANEGKTAEALERMHGLMSRVSAQNADISEQTEERLNQLEQALAAAGSELSGPETALEMNERLAGFERRQADALDSVREALSQFINDCDRRLGDIEQHAGAAALTDEMLIASAIESRLTALEQSDTTNQLETMRRRFEDRVMALESRSIRALEQVAETVAHIERRFTQDGEGEALANSA